jgi:DNA-binding CsgD family transcriptional regulator
MSERRRVHQALADVVDGPAAEEHRAWHLAHAVSAPDEMVADRLEQSAAQACARSGAAAAAAFLARAVEMTPDPLRRTQRTLLAAEAKMNSGAPEAASKMLMDVERPNEDPLLNARIDLLRARAACPSGLGGDMTSLLLATAKGLHDVHAELARDTYLEALVAAILAGRLARPDANALTVASAARSAPPAVTPRVTDLMLDGLVARILDGYVAAAPLLKDAMQEFVRLDAADAVEPRWYDMATRICLDLFDHDTFETIAARQLELFRNAGVLAQLPVGLGARAAVDVFGGRLADAAARLTEAEATANAIGSPRWRRSEPHLAAYRGDEKDCLDMVHAIVDGGAVDHGQGFSIAAGLFALGVLHNGLGQYAEALRSCEQALAYDDPAITGYALVETVEAAARCGDLSTAAEALATLVERAEASGTDTALGLAARSRALTTDGPVAEYEYREAITHLEKSPAVVYLARSRLVYGEWLRRQGRRVDARAQLRDAYDMFTAMGAEAYRQRAGRELEATGETVRKRTGGDTATGLTAQESAIAKLAMDGHTNSEIGAHLFISARTVEWHLSKIFAKLGVTSRKELRTTPGVVASM